MFYAYYVYETVERTRETSGFSCKRYRVNKKIGEYNTQEEAKRHPSIDNETADGYYLITPEVLEEKVLLPPKNPPKPKEKVDKKKKKK